MKKILLILAMMFACTFIYAQEVYRFRATSMIPYNVDGYVDEVEVPYSATFLIKDGRYIVARDKKVTMVNIFKETEKNETKMYEAYGLDWDDESVYILLCVVDDPDVMGFFWDGAYMIFNGTLEFAKNN